jgi:HD superfamily phosphohydrolase
VQFGHGVDIDRLERRVTAVLWRDHASTHCSVAAWTGGQAAAEGVIATRHSMFSQVYAHRTVRAARAMLNYVAWRWREARTSSRAKEPDLLHDLFEYSSSQKTRSLAQTTTYPLWRRAPSVGWRVRRTTMWFGGWPKT